MIVLHRMDCYCLHYSVYYTALVLCLCRVMVISANIQLHPHPHPCMFMLQGEAYSLSPCRISLSLWNVRKQSEVSAATFPAPQSDRGERKRGALEHLLSSEMH